MHGLISLLPEPYYTQVELLWDGLEDRFGLSYIRVTPFPHFSWQIGEGYQLEAILPLLSQFAKDLDPFEVCVRGVEVFPGDLPVVFLKVLCTTQIRAIHLNLWKMLYSYTDQPNLYYQPEDWQPHVTLALNDLTPAALPNVVKWVKQFNIDWRFTCNDLTIAGQFDDETTCLEARFECGRGLVNSGGCDPELLKP